MDLGGGWERAAQGVGRIAARLPDGGLVAIAEDAAWYTDDGVRWVEAAITLPTEGDPPGGVDHLMAGPAGLLVTADTHDGVIVWHSDDGREWSETSPDINVNSSVSAIAIGTDGFVVFVMAPGCTTDVRGSGDGVTWTTGSFPGGCLLAGAAWMGDAYVAASLTPSSETQIRRIATSPDGTHWSQITMAKPPEMDANMGVLLAEGAGRWVIVGYESDVRPTVPAVAFSTDRGVTWDQGTIADLSDESIGQYQLRDLIHTSRGFFAVGDLETLNDDAPGFILHSEDGVTWRHHLLEQAFTDIEVLDDAVIGFDGDAWAWRPGDA